MSLPHISSITPPRSVLRKWRRCVAFTKRPAAMRTAHVRAGIPASRLILRPGSAVICGDFNFKPEDAEHRRMTTGCASAAPQLVDAWQIANPDDPHQPTVGVYEESWPLYCCDYFFVTQDVASRVRMMRVDGETQASDHQPVILELCD